MENIITFKNDKGDILHGIFHKGNPEVFNNHAIIMLNSGTIYRCGWHKSNIDLARYFAKLGFSVLRFDAHGIGYSEGELMDTEDLHTIHDAIEIGLFSQDTICAVEYVQKKYHPNKIYLFGQCGGALTGIIAAGMDNRVSGLAYLSGPVMMTTSEKTLDMHPRDAQLASRGYIEKLFNPSAWARFLTFQSDYREMYRIFKTRLQERFMKQELIADVGDEYDQKNTKKHGLVINKIFLKAFHTMMERGQEILFIMPTLDRASWTFKEMFCENYLKPGNSYEHYYTLFEVEGANHTFSRDENQIELRGILQKWFEDRSL